MAYDGTDFNARDPVEDDVLWKLADVIEALEPNQVQQSIWGSTRVPTAVDTACRTSACTLGWAAHALTEETGLSYVMDRSGAHIITLNGDYLDGWAEGGALWAHPSGGHNPFLEPLETVFGLTNEELNHAFSPQGHHFWARVELGLEDYDANAQRDLVVAGLRHRARARCSANVARPV